MSATKSETVERHPLAIAWDEWLASDEGQQARAANTLPHNTNHYLENRLHRAFDAGARAATPANAEQLAKLREAAHSVLAYLDKQSQRDYPFNKEPQNLAHALRHALGTQEGKGIDV